MTTIKIAVQKMNLLDSLMDTLIEHLKNAVYDMEYQKNGIIDEIKTNHPEVAESSDEFSKYFADNWRYDSYEAAQARIAACDALIEDIERLAGIK